MLGIMVLVGLIHDITKDVGGRLSNVPPAVLLSVFLRLATFVRTIHDNLYIPTYHPLCSCLFSVPRCLWHNFFRIIWYFINSSGFKRCSFNIMKTPQNFYFKTSPPPSWSEFNTRHYNRHGSTQIIIFRNKTVFVLVFLCKSKNDNVSSRYPFHRFQVHIFYRYAYFH